MTRSLCKVTTSIHCETGTADLLINYTNCCCNLSSAANSTVTLDLYNLEVMITRYSLRHTDSRYKSIFLCIHPLIRDSECLRNWTLAGSKDGGSTWTILSTHTNDAALAVKSAMASWPVDAKNQYYTQFRIQQTGKNSSNSDYLSMAGMELYGYVRLTLAAKHDTNKSKCILS